MSIVSVQTFIATCDECGHREEVTLEVEFSSDMIVPPADLRDRIQKEAEFKSKRRYHPTLMEMVDGEVCADGCPAPHEDDE